jgi:predicted TIM-barrel fold metal-dependent hydrolase
VKEDIDMTGAIDSLSNFFTPESIKKNFLESQEEVEAFERLGLMDNLKGFSPDEFLSYMSDAGVDKVLVTAISSWSYFGQVWSVKSWADEVYEGCQAAPDRILGLYGINPMQRMEGVAELERAVSDMKFKGAHIHPHGFDLRPDHAYYFPYYAKCMELGVPVVLSMGHTQDLLPNEVGRPIHLDKIALYFPELKIVCAHTGWPWIEEAIALASKHVNVFLATSAYAPKYWKPEFVRFINSWGQDKVLWGTDYPMIMHDRSLKEIEELELREAPKKKLLRENAMRVFNLS